MSTPKKSSAKINKNNSTGYHGITTDSKGRYVAQIYHNHKTTRIGVFPATNAGLIEAAKAYDAQAVKIHGDKAKLNFPSGKVVAKSVSKPASKPKAPVTDSTSLGQSIGKLAKTAKIEEVIE